MTQQQQNGGITHLIKRADRGGRMRDLVVDEEEQSVLGAQQDALADEKVELADGEVARDQVLLFVEVGDARLGRLLHNYLQKTQAPTRLSDENNTSLSTEVRSRTCRRRYLPVYDPDTSCGFVRLLRVFSRRTFPL